ncbi:MAG: methyltransferase domain-containing protein [Gammaproteobacteria bacterium]|nr:methyltransferase domain-containing protein [Gammaproteobacteria bacterium]
MINKCRLCGDADISLTLNFGHQPIASQLITKNEKSSPKFPLQLGICNHCGLIQLLEAAPYEALVPSMPLIYKEPEQHLDDLAEQITKIPGLSVNSVFAAVSYKDTTLMDRLHAKNFLNNWQINPKSDLGVANNNANIETLQHYITPETSCHIAAKHGQADCLLARHILEHADKTQSFIKALSELIKMDGYLVIEVPDCTSNLQLKDYTMVWEEHRSYFTENNFHKILQHSGFEPVTITSYPGIYENSLVQIARKVPSSKIDTAASIDTTSLLSVYSAAFTAIKIKLKEYLTEQLAGSDGLVLYGAGHLSAAFINHHDLANLVAFIADDTAEKQGQFLAGSGIPVRSSDAMMTGNYPLCLFGLSPEIEDKVIANNQDYISQGGQFYSALASSNRAIHKRISGYTPNNPS